MSESPTTPPTPPPASEPKPTVQAEHPEVPKGHGIWVALPMGREAEHLPVITSTGEKRYIPTLKLYEIFKDAAANQLNAGAGASRVQTTGWLDYMSRHGIAMTIPNAWTVWYSAPREVELKVDDVNGGKPITRVLTPPMVWATQCNASGGMVGAWTIIVDKRPTSLEDTIVSEKFRIGHVDAHRFGVCWGTVMLKQMGKWPTPQAVDDAFWLSRFNADWRSFPLKDWHEECVKGSKNTPPYALEYEEYEPEAGPESMAGFLRQIGAPGRRGGR